MKNRASLVHTLQFWALVFAASPLFAADGFELLPGYPLHPLQNPYAVQNLTSVNNLIQAGDCLWAATNGGLLVMDLKTSRWSIVWDKDRTLFLPIRQLSYSAPLLWAACENGLFRLDLDSKKCLRLTTQQGLLSDNVQHLSSDKDGVWVSYSVADPTWEPKDSGSEQSKQPARITQFSSSGKLIKHWKLPKAPVHREYEGCCRNLPPSRGLLHRLLSLLGGGGMAWAATEDPELNGTYEWEDNSILQLMADGRSLWVAQNACLRRLDRPSAHFSTWRFERILNQKIVNRVSTIQFFKKKGKILLVANQPYPATWMEHDPKKDLWDVVPGKFRIPAAQGKDLAWVGSSYDLTNASRFVLRYIKDNDTVAKDDEIISNNAGLYYWGLNCILPVKDIIWLGSSKGLYRYDTKDSSFHQFIPEVDDTVPEGKTPGFFPLRMRMEKIEAEPPIPTPTPIPEPQFELVLSPTPDLPPTLTPTFMPTPVKGFLERSKELFRLKMKP